MAGKTPNSRSHFDSTSIRRVGWCIAPHDVIRSCVTIRDYTTLALSPLVEFVAQRAVEQAETLLTPRLNEARANLRLVEAWAAANATWIGWAPPEGGVVAFPRLANITDDRAFGQALMDRYGVLVVPGSCFSAPGHVRIGFGLPAESLQRGLDAVSDLLKQPPR